MAALEAAGDASAGALLEPEAQGHYEIALSLESRLDRRGGGADRREARRRRAAARPGRPRRRASGSAASSTTAARRTSPGSATCTARSARGSGTRAIARARSSTTSAGSTCSRTGRRASSWCASTRRPPRSTCTPATTCSRSTRPRRRCASPSGSARRRRRAAPTGSSAASSAASATPSGRARTSSARSSWRARPTRRRRCGPCSRSATTSRSPRPTTRGRAAPTARRWPSPCATGDLPSQVELHAALAQLAAYRGDWETARAEVDASQTLAEREGLSGKLCFPYSMRGVLLAQRATWTARSTCCGGRPSRPSRSAARRSRSSRCTPWRGALRARGDHADADQALARALDLCERAGLVAQSVEATAARAVNLAAWGKLDQARETADEAAGLADRLRYPSASPRASRPAARRTTTPDLLKQARDAWVQLGRPGDAERCEALVAEPDRGDRSQRRDRPRHLRERRSP